jgi:DNA-3-methyladenine glycosylase I
MEVARIRSDMQEHEWHMPDWWCRDSHPKNDNLYFENLCRCIFQAGLNWSVIDKKWPTTKSAFAEFDIHQVAQFTDSDVQRLLRDEGIVRNKSKILAVIYNAQGFEAIEKQCGSFRAYIDSLDKSDNYSAVVKDLTHKFKHVGPATATLFLYTVGENIKAWG